MNNFRRILFGLPIWPALAQLDAQPELWGQNPERIAVEGSPHAQSSDIWLRFRPKAELHEPSDYGAPHFAEMWPAWHALPGLHAITFDVMRAVEATYLGGCLITRIPPGAQILPHVDRGWHPTFNNEKVYVILRANDRCINYCGDEECYMPPATAWTFRNDIEHAVVNGGETERVAMILTMRVEGVPMERG